MAAWFIDNIPVFILAGIGQGVAILTGDNNCESLNGGYSCTSSYSVVGSLVLFLTSLLSLAYAVWNYGYRQGTTGSSIGKSVMKFKVVSEKTWQPIGFGLSIVRQLAHIVDAHHLLHRLPVPAVGRQAADARRQDHDDGVRAARPAGAAARAALTTADPPLLRRPPASAERADAGQRLAR